MREIWIREYCEVAGGGFGCLDGEIHLPGETTHLRKVRDDDVREALLSLSDEDGQTVYLLDPLPPFLGALP